ncbi:MAG: hypothetical protein WAK86_20870 [Pseudonocardiaceae bacterium]
MASFMNTAEARNRALGAYDSQAHDSAVAEVGLMLRASAGTAAARVSDAWSLCTRLPATLAALEAGRITLAKARRHHPLPTTSTPRRAGGHPRSDLPVPRLPHIRPPLRPRPWHPA